MNLRKDHYRLASFCLPCEPCWARSVPVAEMGQGVGQAVVDVKVGVNLVPPRPRILNFF